VGEKEDAETTRKSSIAYAAGLSIFFAVLSCMGIGWALDRWLGKNYWMVTGIIVGAVVGFYQFVRLITKIK